MYQTRYLLSRLYGGPLCAAFGGTKGYKYQLVRENTYDIDLVSEYI